MTERILNDRYALESKVGEGGMAVTYRARDLLLNRIVAVKLLREQFTSDPSFVERFRREAQAAARLSHENIAGVYDTGRCDGTHYIVMEFVEGTDLKQKLRRDGALPVLNALEIARQIAAALDAAHRGGLVHRDIKPHNILLNGEGKVKVTDFGIAKLTSDSEDTNVIIGSVHYISPEQASGKPTTPSSDLYSLGAVLFEMLTGRTVFEADNALLVAQKQVAALPPSPRALRPEIPPAVESIVMRCLQKDPAARYHSAAELQAVITQLISQLTQEATAILTPAAPSMDATMVMRPPTRPAVPDPYSPRAADPPMAPRRASGGGSGWLIALILIVLAISVGFGSYLLLNGNRPPGNGDDPDPDQPVAQVEVPNLIGAKKSEALVKLKEANLQAKVLADFSDQPEDSVFNQDPLVSTRLQANATVTIWVSKGLKEFTMPMGLANLSLDAAKRAIRDAGYWQSRDFVIKKQKSELPRGTVITTDPPEGAVVKYGKSVALIIAEATPSVEEVYSGTVPNIGVDPVYVKIDITRGDGPAREMWNSGQQPEPLSAGDPIPEQRFSRAPDERVTVRMWAGKDKDSLTEQEVVTYPNPQSPAAGVP